MNSYRNSFFLIKIGYIMLLLGAVFFLASCTTKYERKDIEAYVRYDCGIQKFNVSQETEKVEDEEGYTDYLWTVQIEDGSDLKFHVLNDHYWGMEAVTNYLWDDHEDVILSYLYKKYDSCGLELYEETDEESMKNSLLMGDFGNREELEDLFAELESFGKYVRSQAYDLEIRATFQMENELRDRCSYIVDDGDFFGWYNPKTDNISDLKKEALQEYLLTCLDYRFEDQLAEFSPEEIKEVLKDYPLCVAIYRDEEEISLEFYEDLCANKYYYGISFGTLYEILLREGMSVTGDSWHYSFIGADGSEYEISYDFCDYYFEDPGENGYYYLKDGEQIPMEYFFYNHFREREIEELTGLNLEIGLQSTIRKARGEQNRKR